MAQVSGVQVPPPVPHVNTLPPPPQVSGAVQPPQLRVPPQPSPIIPQVAPASAQVRGVQTGTPH
jgi:hypothetical protein